MLILLESTDELVSADGIPCRVWAGETDQGEPVRALIYRLGVQAGEQTYLYDAELNLHVREEDLAQEKTPEPQAPGLHRANAHPR